LHLVEFYAIIQLFIHTQSRRVMYEGSGLDYGDAYEYGDMDLDESMYLDGQYTYDIEEDYARDTYDLDALAYRHYA